MYKKAMRSASMLSNDCVVVMVPSPPKISVASLTLLNHDSSGYSRATETVVALCWV